MDSLPTIVVTSARGAVLSDLADVPMRMTGVMDTSTLKSLLVSASSIDRTARPLTLLKPRPVTTDP